MDVPSPADTLPVTEMDDAETVVKLPAGEETFVVAMRLGRFKSEFIVCAVVSVFDTNESMRFA